jgi:hypothetical protein
LVLAAFLALFMAVDRLSGPDRPRGTAGGATAATAPTTTKRPTTTTAAATTTTSAPTTTKAPTTTTAATTTTKPATGSTLRPAAGGTGQVLNGVFVPGLASKAATKVKAAGYEVVATNNARGHYTVSRIYYTGGHRADAEAFRDRFPDFREIERAPGNLSGAVALHVVVGGNYSGA